MQELLKKKIAAALGVAADQVAITVPERDEFGHYSTNVAMRMAKEAKKAPLVLAEEYASVLKAADKGGVFNRVEAVKPGFINLWLSDKFLQEQFVSRAEKTDIGGGKTVIVEYSSCNIAKPMHVGHLRSTFIGDALANIHAYVGYNVVRWNYLGDWGTQFGKLIAAYRLWGNKETVEKDPITELVKLYVRFHEELKMNPELEKQGQLEFKKLEDGDKENRRLWEWFKDESLLVFHKMFKRLGVKFDEEIGEAFYVDAVYDLFKDLEKGGFLVQSPEGGKIVNLDAFKLPVALLEKSDGASLYLTRDLALLRHRNSRYKPEKILIVVGNEQALHLQQIEAIGRLLEQKTLPEHIKFGLVLGENGKKLSTREGKAVTLEDVVNEITTRAYAVVSEKNQSLSEAEKKAVAEAVGIGALKYNDLKENRNSGIVFNWEQMLSFSGDSAPYLQYTCVRLMNVIRKAEGVKEGDLADADDAMKQALIKKILDFNDTVALCAETCYTSHLAKYLFELAKLGNQYYESVRILDDENLERRDARLMLIGAVAGTLTKGLNLLGIQVPERI